jgi:hypothetical protein
MLVPGSANPLLLRTVAAAAGGISRSLRFNSSDSAYCSRVPASAGDRRKFTFAAWVKIASLTAGQNVLFSVTDGTTPFAISWQSDGALIFGNLSFAWKETTAKLRDYSAWYHICVSVDTDQASNANRLKFYVNGAQQTDFSTNRDLYLNTNIAVNGAFTHEIGRYSAGSNQYFNGLLADVFFIDGQQLTPSSFTETDATTGQLIPKAYTGSYGTNGFHLEFADNSSNTATTLGKDTSGNSNNWTPNNLSVTAGAGNDSLVDVPINGSQTDTGVGGEVRGNYCTINPLNNGGVTLVNGNLDWTRSAAGSTAVAYSTIAVSSGKWYFETTMNGAGSGVNWECGVATTTTANNIRPGTTATGWGLVTSSTTIIYKQNSNSLTSIFSGTLSTGDVIGVAFDLDNGRIWFARNGTWLEGSPSAGTGASYTNLSGTVSAFFGGDGTAVNGAANFGARSFAYTAPSGFKALCTANLPAPAVVKSNTAMDVLTWTGTGGGRTLTGLAFSPDLVWGKSRSAAYNHQLYDVVRGAGNTKDLSSSLTAAEGSATVAASTYGYLSAFTSDGFTVANGTDGSLPGAYWNASGTTYVGWCWDAGSSTVTNTQGSITSSVRANATAGFSIVTYTGNGTNNATVGHGLGVAPRFLIGMDRTGGNWQVWGANMNNGSFDCIMNLNTSGALATGITTRFRAASSTTFTIGTDGDINANGNTYVTYCFAPVVGYSSFGSYTGNGSADGPFVYTGFRPRWIVCKCSSTNNGYTFWEITDTARGPYNPSTPTLAADLSDAEGSANLGAPPVDMLSNGFKIRTIGSGKNLSGQTYIYAAFAETPFNYARAR